MKITIRFSIASITLFLLITVSVLIVGVGYFAINKILIAAVSNDLHHEGKKACRKISNYLLPLNVVNKQASELFNNDILKPDYLETMMHFLHAINNNEENLCGAFWGNTFGDFFYVNTTEGKDNIEEIVVFGKNHGNKTIQKYYNKDQHLLRTEKINKATLYTLTRPWYQKTVANKKITYVIYNFFPLGSQKLQLGVTAASPIYDKQGNLLGVFGVDMLIRDIAKYINDIKVTKNSRIFVINDIGETMDELRTDATILSPANKDVQLKQESLEIYKKKHETPFIFTFNNEKYIAAYEQISGLQTDNTWFITIVTPMNDVIKPLRSKIFINLILIIGVIPIGLLLISLFSTRISRPIKALAQDAILICRLELNKAEEVTSPIKEVSDMSDAFMRMKNTLTSFQRYIPLALVKKLIMSDDIATVGGENKELTIMFTDIKDFTRISEDMDPQKLMQYLSRYFQIITKIVIDTNGTVDKYIGDGMMAFWGAPIGDSKHALHACQAALKIQEALKQFNQENEKSGEPSAVTRIGINTGSVTVGNVGSDDRLNYTSLGDNVNLANYLEGLNRNYKTSIIVSGYTYALVKSEFELLFLDKITITDKQHMVDIYELLSTKKSDLDPNNEDVKQ